VRHFAYTLASLVCASSMWFYVQHVMIAQQVSEAVQHNIPRGNLSDLYPRWLGARELLLHHRDPYGLEVTREIQQGYYGRAIDPARPFDPSDWQAFAYPVYVSFLLAPTLSLPFALVQTAFRWLLLALTAASVPLWFRILRWRTSVWTLATAVILVLGSFQVIQGIKLQQLTLLVSGLIVISLLLLTEGHLFSAGVLLALASIKPQLALPLSSWLLIWAYSDWKARRSYVCSFLGTLALLILAGELVLPGWIARFWRALIEYRRYNNGAASALELVFTPLVGRVLAGVVIAGIAVICWRLRNASADTAAFHWMSAVVLAATIVIMPKAAPYNHVLLVSAVFMVLQRWPLLWKTGAATRLSLGIAALIVMWPWLAAVAIVIASLFITPSAVLELWTVPLYTSLLIPLAVLAVAGFARGGALPSRGAE